MRIDPANFNAEHKTKMLLEYDRGKIPINPDRFDKPMVVIIIMCVFL